MTAFEAKYTSKDVFDIDAASSDDVLHDLKGSATSLGEMLSEHALPRHEKLDHLLKDMQLGLKHALATIVSCAKYRQQQQLNHYTHSLKFSLDERKGGLKNGASWLDGLEPTHTSKFDALKTYAKKTILADGVAVSLRKEVEVVGKDCRADHLPRTVYPCEFLGPTARRPARLSRISLPTIYVLGIGRRVVEQASFGTQSPIMRTRVSAHALRTHLSFDTQLSPSPTATPRDLCSSRKELRSMEQWAKTFGLDAPFAADTELHSIAREPMLSYAAAFMLKGFVDGFDKVALRKAAMGVQGCLKKYGLDLGDINPTILALRVQAALVFQ
jgi:hypothetical protein